MSTMEVLGAGWKAAKQASRQRRAERREHATVRSPSRVVAALAEHGLYVAAAGCFVTAATLVAIPVGLAVAGVALLILELRAGE